MLALTQGDSVRADSVAGQRQWDPTLSTQRARVKTNLLVQRRHHRSGGVPLGHSTLRIGFVGSCYCCSIIPFSQEF